VEFGRVELIWTVINFVVFAAVMTRLLYRPVLRLLDGRAATIRTQFAEAEQAREQAAREQEAADTRLQQADARAHELLLQASERAKSARRQAEEEAKAAADRQRADARRLTELERIAALAALRRDAADLVVDAATKALGESLDEPWQRRLIAASISALGELQ
jgi:F-type H+-transporting ATPase subunit b